MHATTLVVCLTACCLVLATARVNNKPARSPPVWDYDAEMAKSAHDPLTHWSVVRVSLAPHTSLLTTAIRISISLI